MPRRVVLFDLDGTLIDSAPDIEAAINRMLATAGRPPLDLAAIKTMIGDGAAILVERALDATGGRPAPAAEARLLRGFMADYEANATVATAPYPEVPALLADLAARGFRMGMVTNKPEGATRAVLAGFGLAHYFPVVVGGGTLPGVIKPDPRFVRHSLIGLGATAAEAVLVGDSRNDVLSARNAGLPVILRAGGYGPVPAASLDADVVLESLAELPAMIARLA